MTTRWLAIPFAAALATLAGFAPTARAVDEADLLPVEDAFLLEATAVSRDRIEFHWKIAPGYYLYRERISIQPTDASFRFNPLQLPPGKPKHDEFFGDVEIYRGEVTAVLTGAASDDTVAIAFRVKSQGCADVGVCYPPNTRSVMVQLPPDPNAVVAETAPADNPLAQIVHAQDPAPLLTGVPVAAPAAAEGTDALPLPEDQAFVAEAIPSSGRSVLARFTMPPGYYLYRDRTTFELRGAPGAKLGAPQWPQGAEHEDEHFGKVIVYYNQVEVPIAVEREAGGVLRAILHMTYQGCQEDGICYPPMKKDVSLDLPAAAAVAPAEAPKAPAVEATGATGTAAMQAPLEQSEQDRLAAALAGPNKLATLFVFFLGGILLAFTPCVFPMIPILSGIIAGAGAISNRRALVLSVVYVLASALVFTIAGMAAGLAGQNLQAAFQNPWILSAFALLFVALAFSMFGYYELQLPSSWQSRIADVSNRQQGGSVPGVAIMGALSALIVGPCVAPPLAAAVIYIAEQRDPILGGAALFALGLGMGVPLIAFVMGVLRLMPGGWMEAIKRVFGVLFLLLAIWMLERFLPVAPIMLMIAAVLIGSAIFLGALDRLPDGDSGWTRVRKAIGVLLLALGVAQVIGALAGAKDWLQPLKGVIGSSAGVQHEEVAFKTIKSSSDLDRELAEAKNAGKPVVLDFYADWCVSCKEMEKYTLPESKVQGELTKFVRLKADVTQNDDADQGLLQRFGLIGPPATVFFAPTGEEKRPLRLIGFEGADPFATRLQRAAE